MPRGQAEDVASEQDHDTMLELLPQTAPPWTNDGIPPKTFQAQVRWHLEKRLVILRGISRVIIPSFLLHDTTESPDAPIRPTAYLDGLRGIAAFVVYTHHIVYTFTDDGFAYTPERPDWYRLPFLRLLSSGSASVLVFFIVSSYSLSLKPVRLMRQRRIDAALSCLQSAALRRAVRLYVPLIVASALWLVCINLGLFDATKRYWEIEKLFTGYREHHPAAPRAFFSTEDYTLGHWLKYIFHLCSTHISYWWDDGVWSLYDEHAWTIPVEFFASMTLFMTLVAVSPLRSTARITILGGLVVLALFQDWYELILFWTGPILVEVGLIYSERQEDAQSLGPHWQRTKQSLRIGSITGTIMQGASLVTALYLLGTPEHECDLPSSYYSTVCSISPPGLRAPWRFWASIGAMLLVVVVGCSDHLSRLLSGHLCRYLGRISFALYLVHGLVNHLVGFAVFHVMFKLMDPDLDGVMYKVAWSIAFVMNTVIVVCVSDVFTRAVDEPIVTAVKNIEKRLS